MPPSMTWHSCDSIQLPPGGAVGPDAVHQDARVARLVLPGRPGPLAPLPLDDQVIVVELVLRRQAAELLARDADHAVADREDLVGIVAPAVVQVGIEAGQVLAVEPEDRLARPDRPARPGRTRGPRPAGLRIERPGRGPEREAGEQPGGCDARRDDHGASSVSAFAGSGSTSTPLAMDLGTLLPADRLDLGQRSSRPGRRSTGSCPGRLRSAREASRPAGRWGRRSASGSG